MTDDMINTWYVLSFACTGSVHHVVGHRWSFRSRVGVATRPYRESADDHRAAELHHLKGRDPSGGVARTSYSALAGGRRQSPEQPNGLPPQTTRRRALPFPINPARPSRTIWKRVRRRPKSSTRVGWRSAAAKPGRGSGTWHERAA